MNDEIKEIKINKANKSVTFINNGIAFSQFGIADEILDLITNLQQENERLKERVAYLERSNDRREDTITGLRFEVAEQEDYKSRCEKAIEYNNQIIKDIKDFYRPTTDIIYSGDCIIDIAKININILQNGSDSQ